MKYFTPIRACTRWILILFFSASGILLHAVHPVKEPVKSDFPVDLSSLTVNQYLAIDPSLISKSHGVKYARIKRWMFRHTQHQLIKKVNKHKISGESKLFESVVKKTSDNKRGKLATILAGAGFIFLFLGPLAFISLPLAISSIILGILGIQKDRDITLSIIGLVLGGLILLIMLFAILVLITLFQF